MSLTSHLADKTSPIRCFLEAQFPNTRPLLTASRKFLIGNTSIAPPFSPGTLGLIGTAFDYRLRYAFSVTPTKDLVAWKGSRQWVSPLNARRVTLPHNRFAFLQARTGTVHIVNPDSRFLPVRTRPLCGQRMQYFEEVSERSLDRTIVCKGCAGRIPEDDGFEAWLALGDAYFAQLEQDLAELSPARRRLPVPDDARLARHCIVLALYEQIARSRGAQSPLIVPEPPTTVSELLALAQPAWVEDLCALTTLFFVTQQHLLSQPARLNPTFAGSSDVGGADADLIIDACLFEIKATVRPHLEGRWLYQLLGYSLLDYDDAYGLHEVGIYLARQGILLHWTLDELLLTLSGGAVWSLPEIRSQFKRLCQRYSEDNR